MKTSKYAMAVTLGLIGLLAPIASRADSIVQVTISNLTFNGASVCGPTGTALCTQTLSESWLWDNTTLMYVPGSFSSSTTGVLGTSFTLLTTPVVSAFSAAVWVLSNIQNPNGDQLTVYLGLGGSRGPLVAGTYTLSTTGTIFVPPGTFDVNLTCASTDITCNAAYPGLLGQGSFGVFSTGGTVTVTTAPEPHTAALLGAGLFGLMGLAVFRKRLA